MDYLLVEQLVEVVEDEQVDEDGAGRGAELVGGEVEDEGEALVGAEPPVLRLVVLVHHFYIFAEVLDLLHLHDQVRGFVFDVVLL